VQIEADRLRNFVRFFVNCDVKVEASHLAHQTPVERSYRLRLESEAGHAAVARVDRQLMPDEIEIDLECSKAVWNWRGGEACGSYVESGMPRVIDPRGLREANLTRDLYPHVKGGVCFRPAFERQAGPEAGEVECGLHRMLPFDSLPGIVT